MDNISRLTWFGFIVSEKYLINARIADAMQTSTDVNLDFTSSYQSQKYIACRVYLTKGNRNQKLNLAFISLNLPRFADPSQTLSLQTYKSKYITDVLNCLALELIYNYLKKEPRKNSDTDSELIKVLATPVLRRKTIGME